jgi:hypothetical protein
MREVCAFSVGYSEFDTDIHNPNYLYRKRMRDTQLTGCESLYMMGTIFALDDAKMNFDCSFLGTFIAILKEGDAYGKGTWECPV